MRIGLMLPFHGGGASVVQRARTLGQFKFSSYWIAQGFGLDALAALMLIAREIPQAELGTAVVPIFGRHPAVLAMQALTAQVACEGRLTLGIGLSHRVVIEDMFGLSFKQPARQMDDYLQALLPLLRRETVRVETSTAVARMAQPIDVPDAAPVPVIIAALGERMLEIAGRLATGTLTWMTGPKTLRDYTIPTITRAANDAGRAKPRIIAGLPVCIAKDVAGMRDATAKTLGFYGNLPSYAAMLAREGLQRPIDVAIMGTAPQIRSALTELAEAGVTDLLVQPVGPAEAQAETFALLAELNPK